MAEAGKTTSVWLVLDEDEAGYLYDMLYRYVGGTLVWNTAPLGRIRDSLRAAGVANTRTAYQRGGLVYVSLHASEADARNYATV